MGFAPQIEMVLQNIRPDRQTVLFSATFPKQIEKLAKTVLRMPLEVVVGERSSVNKDITQVVEVHEDADKFMRLLQLLGVWYEKGSVLIFVDTQEKCDQLFHDLLKSGYPCLSLHGGKDQLDRDHTLHEFKKGVKTVMVATSVAGRGLDVPDIVVVVNYNCPNHIEDYVHRVGRTGRAGRKGTAYTFISPSEEQYSPLMIKALEKAGQVPAAELLEMVAAFKEKVSRGEARYCGGGFDGKGFTFDASEMSETQKNANLQRKAYDIEQGIDEKGEEEEEDEDTEKEKTAVGAAAPSAPAGLSALDRAIAIATSLCLSKGLPVPIAVTLPASLKAPTSTSSSLGLGVDSGAAMEKARLIAAELAKNKKLGDGPEVETVTHFSEELDINDYPPQVRHSDTIKTILSSIYTYSILLLYFSVVTL
jgi:ATP-dependent RNA helicase DDX46/PRP5